MPDYRKSRSNPLRPMRIYDTLFTDTFYLTRQSIQGKKCFQIFALQKCIFSVAMPMKTESNVYDSYADFIINVGTPNIYVSNTTKVYLHQQ